MTTGLVTDEHGRACKRTVHYLLQAIYIALSHPANISDPMEDAKKFCGREWSSATRHQMRDRETTTDASRVEVWKVAVKRIKEFLWLACRPKSSERVCCSKRIRGLLDRLWWWNRVLCSNHNATPNVRWSLNYSPTILHCARFDAQKPYHQYM